MAYAEYTKTNHVLLMDFLEGMKSNTTATGISSVITLLKESSGQEMDVGVALIDAWLRGV